MVDTINRRSFLQAMGLVAPLPHSLHAAAPEAKPLLAPHFPGAAHQLVWRNWDLVPAERIAAALGCDLVLVGRIAASMALRPQTELPRYPALTRLKLLRRNWDFVPDRQLAILLDVPESALGELAREDEYFNVLLGPKGEFPAISAAGVNPSSELIPHFRAASDHGPEQERFHFIEELNRPIPSSPFDARNSEASFSPRIVFPYFAPFGDVLKDDRYQSYYPSGFLQNLRRVGLDSIWLNIKLNDVVKTSVFPEFGAESERYLERLNWVIQRAKENGLRVYVWLNEPRGMPAAFFNRHPDIQGAPGRPRDGLFSMCTSTEQVQKYMVEASAALFRHAPGLKGFFLITASENPTNCYSIHSPTPCPRCSRRSGPEVIGEVVKLMEQGSRRSRPDAEIIVWDWSWKIVEPDPQHEVIAHLPSTVTLMVDFERGTPIERKGIKSVVDEYSLSIVGPSPRAAAHIQQAKSRGMRVMAKIQLGVTWELCLLPYLPVHELLAEKFVSLRQQGISALLASWTFGGYPSPNAVVASAYYGKSLPDPQQVLRTVAAELYGKAAVSHVLNAWHLFAASFRQYPFSGSVVYSSIVQEGPAHLVYWEPTGQGARVLNTYDNLRWTQPFGPDLLAQIFDEMAAGWEEGIRELEKAMALAPTDKRTEAGRDLKVSQAVGLCFRSVAHQVRFLIWRDKHRAGPALTELTGAELDQARRVKEMLEEEIKISIQFLNICNADSRVGFEASMQYYFLPLDIREKIAACRFILDKKMGAAG